MAPCLGLHARFCTAPSRCRTRPPRCASSRTRPASENRVARYFCGFTRGSPRHGALTPPHLRDLSRSVHRNLRVWGYVVLGLCRLGCALAPVRSMFASSFATQSTRFSPLLSFSSVFHPLPPSAAVLPPYVAFFSFIHVHDVCPILHVSCASSVKGKRGREGACLLGTRPWRFLIASYLFRSLFISCRYDRRPHRKRHLDSSGATR
ncbi:hypothetical protein K438DRAFT_128169 [Mycena galopus ATCC 62051]|nr:hypothetical protein K438DRAFT_128169 [Mycena galopus ATCC 62051]